MAASSRVVTRGLVLRETERGESDKLLTVLSGDLGRIPVIAKGARSRRSKVTAAAQLLAYSELVLSESHGWLYLSEAATLELFQGVRQDVLLLSLASYLAQLTEAVTPERSEAEEMLRLLLNALYALGTLKKPPELVKCAFTWRLLSLAGFEPLVQGCARCGKEQPEQPVLDVLQGLLLCQSCREPGPRGLSMPLCPGSLAALRHILYSPPEKLYAFTLKEESLLRLNQAAEAFCAAQLERSFPTLDFYKTLSRQAL